MSAGTIFEWFSGISLAPLVDWSWAVLNTNFSAALFGALAGALSAHGIAMRAERRKRLRDEIAGVNNAIALANGISNAFVAIKRQHVMGMAALYKRSFDEYAAIVRAPPAVPTEFTFITDFRSLAMPLTPIDELRQVLLDRVQSSGAAISISVPLHQSISGLANILALREETFSFLRAKNDADRILAYFGLRTSDGHIDQRYPDQMNGIIAYVDDGIYFPVLICEVLSAHGKRLAKSYGRKAPKVHSITYAAVAEAGLLPDPTNYPDFENIYRKAPPVAPNIWARIRGGTA